MSEVFLSYCHKDNDSCDPEYQDRAWVTEFYQNLEDNLLAICKPEDFTKLFIDKRDRQGEVVLDDLLLNALDRARILVSVLSGNYERSEWCQAERVYFLTNVLEGSNYNLLVEKVPYADKKELIIYEFYEEKDGRWETLCIHNRKQEYFKRIMDLSNDIRGKLKHKAEGRPKVFLSLSTPDINFRYRRKIKSELERLGFVVVPESFSINKVEDFNQKICDALSNVQHAFFILGNKRSLSPEGSEKTLEELQFEMGFNNKQIPKTIWYPSFYENIEGQQILFIERFTKDSSPGYINQKFDLLECSLAKFVSELEGKVRETFIHNISEVRVIKEKNAFILASDKKLLTKTERFQFEERFSNLGYKVLYPLFEGTPEEIRSHRDKNVCEADFIVLWLSDDLSANVVTSLIGDLKRATNADNNKKIIYGQVDDDFGFNSFNNLDDIISYIK